MGYACPVCEEPQVDDEHLANHLAFTAILRGGEHEEWLEDHVADWGSMAPDALAAAVRDDAPEVEIEGVEASGHAGDRPDAATPPGGSAHRQTATDRLTAADRAVLEEARELTRRMVDADSPSPGADGEETAGDPEPEKE